MHDYEPRAKLFIKNAFKRFSLNFLTKFPPSPSCVYYWLVVLARRDKTPKLWWPTTISSPSSKKHLKNVYRKLFSHANFGKKKFVKFSIGILTFSFFIEWLFTWKTFKIYSKFMRKLDWDWGKLFCRLWIEDWIIEKWKFSGKIFELMNFNELKILLTDFKFYLLFNHSKLLFD